MAFCTKSGKLGRKNLLKLPIDKKLAVWYNGNSARVRCARAAEKNSAANC
jgi:hypothetical protein